MNKEHRLLYAILFSSLFMIVEICGGVYANSLAVLSDAAHLLTDIFGFSLALLAAIVAKSAATKFYTFGLARAEVLGAIASIITLWILTAGLVYEAVKRMYRWFAGTADPIDGKLMFIIACIGVLVNIGLSTIFSSEHGGAFHGDHDHTHGHGHSHKASGKHDAGHSHKEHDHGHRHDHGHGHDHEPKSKKCSGSSHDHHSHEHEHSGQEGHDSHKHGSHKSTSDIEMRCGHDNHSNHAHEEHIEINKNVAGNMYGAVPTHEHQHQTEIDIVEQDHHREKRGHEEVEERDVNLEAAYLHVITDLIQSVGVALAGLCIWIWPSCQFMDPVCTFVFSGLVLWSTLSLFKRAMNVLFEGTPLNVDYHKLLDEFRAIPGVIDVHDLHVWTVSSDSNALTCHMLAKDSQAALARAHVIAKDFRIKHATIQVQDATVDGQVPLCYSESCNAETSSCMKA